MDLYLECPSCKQYFVVAREDLRCRIFRHAVFRDTLSPIPPHSSKTEIETYLSQNKIYGCGKPFRVLEKENHEFYTEICDYL